MSHLAAETDESLRARAERKEQDACDELVRRGLVGDPYMLKLARRVKPPGENSWQFRDNP